MNTDSLETEISNRTDDIISTLNEGFAKISRAIIFGAQYAECEWGNEDMANKAVAKWEESEAGKLRESTRLA